MKTHLITDIPFRLDSAALLRRLHMDETGMYAPDILAAARQAQDIARPKAIFRMVAIEEKTDFTVRMDGVTFTSRILRVNLEKPRRAFAFVATCGVELAQWAATFDDPLIAYAADIIQEMGLFSAIESFGKELERVYEPGKTAMMNPGSLADWPLAQQKPLFEMLGEVEAGIGVRLTESFLMLPSKSVSGIRFATDDSYENCMLCEMENCPGRRAQFEPALFEQKYRKEENSNEDD